MVGIQGTVLDRATKEFLSEIRPNGIILFSRNIENPRQLAELNRDLQRYALSMDLDPFFISVDQEGGRVRRLREPFCSFPSSWEMAGSDDPIASVRNFAVQTANELRLAGFNLDFVPVLDVVDENINLSSTVIGDRSFGSNPETVARLGSLVITQMRAQGIIPCGKHFPGHGATAVDSHFDLPVDDRPFEVLFRRDLVPFQKAIQNSVEMLMTAHVLFPKIDPKFPATMSRIILEGLLRTQIGFKGLIITDDLDMGAVSKRYSTERCVIESFQAGADILLICNSQDKSVEALISLRDAFNNGIFDEHRLFSSLDRIASLKRQYAKSFKPCDPEVVSQLFSC